MAIDLYRLIREHADSGEERSAGDLHEDIWTDLLARGDPSFNNVRLARGDGSIDGIEVLADAPGRTHVYQAKFFPRILGEGKKVETDRTATVANAFRGAHSHSFACVRWTLLVPFALSAKEISWLQKDMPRALEDTPDAAVPRDLTKDSFIERVRACAIEWRGETQLLRLLESNLDVAAKRLPRSHLYLANKLKDQEDGVAARLRALELHAVHARQLETRKAKAAVHSLNFGWANYVGHMDTLSRTFTQELARLDTAGRRNLCEAYHDKAMALADHARASMSAAYHAEGLLPGAAALILAISQRARMLPLFLHQAAHSGDGSDAEALAKTITGDLRAVYEQVAKAMGWIKN